MKELERIVLRGILVLLALLAPGTMLAATFSVDSIVDASDVAAGDGTCASLEGTCTLRAAVEEADALAGADTIMLAAAKYKLLSQIAMASDITVVGPGADVCKIRGVKKTRILHIQASASVTLSGVTIERGRAESGGAILNEGWLLLTEGVVATSHAKHDDAGLGGGIYNDGVLELLNVHLFNNRATGSLGGLGGSLYNNGSAILTNVRVARSRATGCGGAVFNNAGSIEMTNAKIERNSVRSSGGGLFHQAGAMTLTNALVQRNRAKAIGGGVFTYGDLWMTNVTLSINRAKTGGGLFSRLTPTTELVNVTIAANIAGDGAGIMNNGSVSLKNTIVSGNIPTNCEGTPVTSNGHNLDGDASCALSAAGDLSSVDPLLGELLDDGTGTLTHALLPGSPAIDAGDDVGCPGDDQRGQPRPSDGDGNSTPTCDIGAYELQP